jgi:hypothetical protein
VGGDALDAEIEAVIATLSDEQRAEPRFFPSNYVAWNDFFRCMYDCELAAYEGPPSSRAQQRRRPPLLRVGTSSSYSEDGEEGAGVATTDQRE